MNVLLLADHCNPRMASTPYFGFQIVRALARALRGRGRVTLATQHRNRAAFTADALGVDELVFLDSEYVARRFDRLSRSIRRKDDLAFTLNTALSYPANLAFEWEAWKHFGARLRRGEFDVVHRVTPLSPTLASPMARWSPVPFVLGPINGGLPWPAGFRAELAREREWLSYVRGLARLMPYYRSTYRRAAAVLAGFRHTAEFLPAWARDRCFDCSDVGYEDPFKGAGAPPRPATDTMNVLFAGRLVPYKCPDVVVRAFAASPSLRRHRLVIVGDGPERPALEAFVRTHGLEGCVEFTGWLPHAEVQKRFRAADVFAFPSVRELGAGVVVEAMGLGLPCVVVDYGSPGAYAADDRGVALPLTDKAGLVDGYVQALEALAVDPDRRARLGAAAMDYARTFHTWDAKARKIVQVYEWALGRRADRPDFYAPPTPMSASAQDVGPPPC